MRVNAVILGIAGCWLIMGAAPARAQNGDTGRSVADGVYTEEQAERGQATFSEVCANCHTSGQFAGPAFQSMWEGRNVRSLFRLLRTTMPYDNPGGLTRDEYAAIIAYILEVNGHPPGPSELPTGDDDLRQIRFEAGSDSGATRR